MPESLVGKIENLVGSGCSPLFISSAMVSVYNGKKNRQLSRQKAKDDIEFQKQLEIQKEKYSDEKEAEEWAFKKWLKRKQREYEREESYIKILNDYKRVELKLFFKDWPLHVEINSILKLYNSNIEPIQQSNLNIILGKHSIDDKTDILSTSYNSIIDNTSKYLSDLTIKDKSIFRFGDNKTVGGAALANVFALMNKLPTLMIMPTLIEDHLHYNIGLWVEGSIFPTQKSIFSIECNPYKLRSDINYYNLKMEEIIMSNVAIIGVLNDTYRMVEYNMEPMFPLLNKKYNILRYTTLEDFAKREYESLQNPLSLEFEGQIISISEIYSISEQKEIANLSNLAIKRLK